MTFHFVSLLPVKDPMWKRILQRQISISCFYFFTSWCTRFCELQVFSHVGIMENAMHISARESTWLNGTLVMIHACNGSDISNEWLKYCVFLQPPVEIRHQTCHPWLFISFIGQRHVRGVSACKWISKMCFLSTCHAASFPNSFVTDIAATQIIF